MWCLVVPMGDLNDLIPRINSVYSNNFIIAVKVIEKNVQNVLIQILSGWTVWEVLFDTDLAGDYYYRGCRLMIINL